LDTKIPGFTLPNYDLGHFLGISVSSHDISIKDFYIDPKATKIHTNDQGEIHLETSNFHVRLSGSITAVWQVKIWFIDIKILTTTVSFDASSNVSNFDAAI